MIAKKKKGTKAGNVHKRMNLGFTKELYEGLSDMAKQEKRSIAGQIEFILEKELANYNIKK